MTENFTTSGYTPCACRDCMDIAISSDQSQPELCSECKAAGCVVHDGPEPTVHHPGTECQRDDAYGEC